MAVSTPLSSIPSSQPTKGFLPGLTLANGMTAGIGPEQPFNAPLGSYAGAGYDVYGGSPWWQTKRVGCMRSYPGAVPGAPTDIFGQHSYYLFFLYNPSQIQVGFSIDPAATPPVQVVNNQFGVPVAPGSLTGQSVTWSLFFDRTYDIVYGQNQAPGQNRGVLHDVAALYNILGVYESGGTTVITYPVQVMFGETETGEIWGFTGFVTGLSITYGIFKYNMIPSRCEIDITLTARYLGAWAPSSDSGTTLSTDTPNQTPSGVPIPPQIQPPRG